MKKKLCAALAGAAAGAVNGLFGAGGGLLLVPLLTGLCRLEDRKAFATAIAVIAPLCAVSLIVYGFRGSLALRAALPCLAGGLLGGLTGGRLYGRIPSLWLHRILGLLILYGGGRNLLG